MPLKLNTASGGSVTLDPANTASNFTLTVPAATTTMASTDTAQTLTNKTLGSGLVMGASAITSGTAVSATGTAVDFTGIPSWVKRITVMFNGVSTNGTSIVQVQLGTSSGVTSSGYSAAAIGSSGNSGGGTTFTSGFGVADAIASNGALSGHFVATQQNGNSWVASFMLFRANGANLGYGAGNVSLASTLDRVRITTVNGTDTFDAGTINILYE